jgi:hypothetical protein
VRLFKALLVGVSIEVGFWIVLALLFGLYTMVSVLFK